MFIAHDQNIDVWNTDSAFYIYAAMQRYFITSTYCQFHKSLLYSYFVMISVLYLNVTPN